MELRSSIESFFAKRALAFFGGVLLVGLVLIAAFGGVAYVVGGKLLHKSLDGTYSQSTESQHYKYTTSDGDACNVAIIPVDGELFVSSADAVANGGTYLQSGVTAGLAGAQTVTPSVSSGAGATLAPATYDAVEAVPSKLAVTPA